MFVRLMQEYRLRELFKPSMAELGLCIYQFEYMLQVSRATGGQGRRRAGLQEGRATGGQGPKGAGPQEGRAGTLDHTRASLGLKIPSL